MWQFLLFVLIISLVFGLISWMIKAAFFVVLLVGAIALLYFAIKYIDKLFDAAVDRKRIEIKKNG